MKTENFIITNKELSITKILEAPISQVWKVWTRPELITNWWGAKGFTNKIDKMEVEPGGEWRFMMHDQEGNIFPHRSVFIEIIFHKKIVFQHYNPEYLATVLFEHIGNETIMEWKMDFETPELLETVLNVMDFDRRLEQTVRKLTAYLASFEISNLV